MRGEISRVNIYASKIFLIQKKVIFKDPSLPVLRMIYGIKYIAQNQTV